MKKDITKFVNKKSREENVMILFDKLLKEADTKDKIRELELRLLRPQPLEDYKGPKTAQSNLKARTVMVVLPNKNIVERWAELFKVARYIENNTYDIDFLVELFNLMKAGRIEWNSERRKYYMNTRNGMRVKL